MHLSEINSFYERYIACLNNKRLEDLDQFVNKKLTYNKKGIELKDYQQMLAQNFEDIPDLYFEIDFIVASENQIASRLNFNCTPVAEFMGIQVNGRKVSFSEHVFYKLIDSRISEVWSLIDKDAIKDQIAG